MSRFARSPLARRTLDTCNMAEGMGFEPMRDFRLHTLSKRAP